MPSITSRALTIWMVFIYKLKKLLIQRQLFALIILFFSKRNRCKIGTQKFLEFRNILPIQTGKHVCDVADIRGLFCSKQDIVSGEPQHTGEPSKQSNGKSPATALNI